MAATITSWEILNNNGTTADVKLHGTGFGTTQYPIKYNGVTITVVSWTDALITGTVPSTSLDLSIDGKVLASSSDATPGFLDAKVSKSITVNENKIELASDLATPGNDKVYATNASGIKGWYDAPSSSTGETDWSPLSLLTSHSTNSFVFASNLLGLNTSRDQITVGKPLKYGTVADGFNYGVITNVVNDSTNVTVTFAGPSLVVSNAVLAIGKTNKIQNVVLAINGFFADAADTALLKNDMFITYPWLSAKAHIAMFEIVARLKDSGAANSRVNLTINSNAVCTSNSNAGLEVNNSFVSTTNDLTNHTLNYGDLIEVTVDNFSTNKDARDLTVVIVTVHE